MMRSNWYRAEITPTLGVAVQLSPWEAVEELARGATVFLATAEETGRILRNLFEMQFSREYEYASEYSSTLHQPLESTHPPGTSAWRGKYSAAPLQRSLAGLGG